MAYVRNNYNIDANKPKYYIINGKVRGGQKENISGRIDLTVTSVDGLHIGNGFVNYNKDGIYRETMKKDGKAIIPAASVKGCVRHIASIASDGCLINPKRQYKKYRDGKPIYYFPFKEPDICNPKKDKDNKVLPIYIDSRCIICDMFGKIGRMSKVSFSDLISSNASFEVRKMNAQFTPEISSTAHHENGEVFGYKIYFTKCEKYDIFQKDAVELVKPGAVFTGSVFFNNLTEDEMSLLCFSLGLSKTINLKIGGYKNDGIGQIKVKGKIVTNVGEFDGESAAFKHIKNYGDDDVYSAIETLENYLKPYEGVVR